MARSRISPRMSQKKQESSRMNRSLPLFQTASTQQPALSLHEVSSHEVPLTQLLAELQSLGLRWTDRDGPGLARKGGAGPSDHKAISLGNQTIMVPIFTHASGGSPYTARVHESGIRGVLERDGVALREISFPEQPRFYSLGTRDGIPYW